MTKDVKKKESSACEPKKNWTLRLSALGFAIVCGIIFSLLLNEDANDRSASGMLYLGDADCREKPPNEMPACAVRFILKKANLPELAETAGLVELGLTHVADATATPCRSELVASGSEKNVLPDAAAGDACQLTKGPDKGVTIASSDDGGLGIDFVRLFQAEPEAAKKPATFLLFSMGANALAVVRGKSAGEPTLLTLRPDTGAELRLLNDKKYGLPANQATRIVAHGVKGQEARTNLRWRATPQTIWHELELTELSGRLAGESDFVWLGEQYQRTTGSVVISAPRIGASIGLGCEGNCVKVRFQARDATLKGEGIAIKGDSSIRAKQFETFAAVCALILAFCELFL